MSDREEFGRSSVYVFDDALAVLTRIDGPDYAQQEIEEIRASLDQETGGWGDLFVPGMRYALLVGILLALFNNWTGWSVIGGYVPMLFEMSGLENRAQAITFATGLGYALHDEALIAQAKGRLYAVADHMNPNGLLFLWWLDRNNPGDRKAVTDALEGWPLWACGLLGRAITRFYADSQTSPRNSREIPVERLRGAR